MMCNRMSSYVDQFSLLKKCQFGFRKSSSTVDAITEFWDNVCNAVDNRESVVSVFMDFQKAFDTVDHNILIRKLNILGFRGPVSSWFESYLSNRKHCVSINDTRSQLLHVNRGLPQGSVLGPLLFNLYINDMHAATSLDVIHYADDTTVFRAGFDVAAIVHFINAELLRLDTWLCANRLSLNTSKSKALILTKRNLEHIPPVVCRGVTLNYVDSYKFLGVTLEKGLSFKIHGMNMISKLSRALEVMRKLSYTVPGKVMLTLYYSLFYSHLTYAIVVWAKASLVVAGRISSLQTRAIKLLDKSNNAAANFHQFHILNYYDIVRYFCALKFFKCIRDQDGYFFHRIQSAQVDHGYETRFAVGGSLTNVYCRTNCSLHSFLPQSIGYWNELPDDIKSAPTLQKFKVLLRRFYLSRTT